MKRMNEEPGAGREVVHRMLYEHQEKSASLGIKQKKTAPRMELFKLVQTRNAQLFTDWLIMRLFFWFRVHTAIYHWQHQ